MRGMAGDLIVETRPKVASTTCSCEAWQEAKMKAEMIGGTAEHPITVRPAKGRAKVSWKGAVVVDSAKALDLEEAHHPKVKYFRALMPI